MNNLIAQIQLGPLRGKGPLGFEGEKGELTKRAIELFNQVISATIGLLTIIAAIWFIVQFFAGALGIISAGGDKAKLTEARAKLTSAVIGLVVIIAAVFIIQLIGSIIGFDILGGAKLIEDLAP